MEMQDFEETTEMCKRCNCCEMTWEECHNCGGEGGRNGEELMMEDPFWYDINDFVVCDICEGKGGFYICTCDENGKHKSKL